MPAPITAGLIPGSLSIPAAAATAPPQTSMPMTSLAHTYSAAPPVMSFAPPTSTITSIPPPNHNSQKLIPPPAISLSWENPTLYAQQQAQMIAQQSLLARQNAQNEQILFAHLAHMNVAAVMAQQNGVAAASPSAPGILGLQPNSANLGLLPTAMPAYGHMIPQAGAFAANPYVLVPQRFPLIRHPGLAQVAAPISAQTPVAPLKRSYDQAFTGDLATHGLHKRPYAALPQAPSTLAYTQFYPNV
uniref:Putative product n=1 Tax=Xenopsylla cheopis TaxID=163159 RepID=A0A6M2DXZ1_XENCH